MNGPSGFERLTGAQLRQAGGFADAGHSVASVILAHLELGLVLEAQGAFEEARDQVGEFLERWGQPDRPLAVLESARALAARLEGATKPSD